VELNEDEVVNLPEADSQHDQQLLWCGFSTITPLGEAKSFWIPCTDLNRSMHCRLVSDNWQVELAKTGAGRGKSWLPSRIPIDRDGSASESSGRRVWLSRDELQHFDFVFF
jgi:hypothetical protein